MTPAPAARLAQRVAALRGWRRHLLAFVLGVLVTLGLPPGHLVPLIAVGFTGLLWLLDGAERGRTAFWTGWWFGFGLLLTGLYWISISLFVEIERWWWLLPLAVTFLPAAFSIYTGSMIWALWRLRWGGWRRVAALAVLWVLGEWLRGKLFTGFPWHIVGYAWSEVHPVQQAASVVGAYGMGLLTVLLAGLPALFAWLPPRRALLANAAGLAGLALVAGLGAARLPDGPPPADGPLIRIVQPNIPQAVKLSDEAMRRAFDSLRALSTRPTAAPPAAVVWPETAVPYLLTDEPVLLQWVGGSLPAGSGLVLTGSLRADQGADGRRFYNSLVAVDGGGRPVAAYDKFHLVPFGEFMPLRDILPFEGIAQGNVDFSTGPGPTTLALPGLPPFSPLICYE
ncbi:MAG TPA: apolipoprotein N-acyltransferase, partial [Alphaproteobacteria bacterium]|nr:apolipoprotein N-acyltransferase [Alphaproteobacteria bacterium]